MPMASLQQSAVLHLVTTKKLNFLAGNGKKKGYGLQMGVKGWNNGVRCSSCKYNKHWQQHSLSKNRTLGIPILFTGYKMQFMGNGVPALRALQTSLPTDQMVSEGTKLPEMLQTIKDMLKSINDGEISVSAYDTAWVALIKDVNGGEGPQFPSSLEWIVSNQLPDGSWGDAAFFSAHDRMINTLACVIVLTTWRIQPERRNTGLRFLRENMCRLAEEATEHMLIGFEIVFPTLMEMAKDLGLELPFDDPILRNINAMREKKLKRIPKDVMHEVPSTLLFSLEGMPDLNWERLLKFQCDDGSCLFSPSSTAYAFIQTSNEKCIAYLQQVVNRFHGGAPNVYPVNIFERSWVVDRLERLGISRYFKAEIVSLLDYVHKSWTDQGVYWARNSTVIPSLDDMSMAFRLIRLHGYEVSPCVFNHLLKDGEFLGFKGESNLALTVTHNLNRASQIMLPDEHILQQAMNFSYKFLREKQGSGQLKDKWFIAKDIPGEVAYALDFPWYASLPRVEARLYIDQYGGSSDVWIGKTLYRMPLVCNDWYLELAKEDFNRCQTVHQLELHNLQSWYKETELERFKVKRKDVQRAYFLAAASIFEPERALERLAWALTSILANAITSFFSDGHCSEKLHEFILNFLGKENSNISSPGHIIRTGEQNKRKEGLMLAAALNHTLELMSSESGSHSQNQGQQEYIYHYLRHAWMKWLLTWKGGEAYHRLSPTGQKGLLLVNSIEICSGRSDSDDLGVFSKKYRKISELTTSICYSLHDITLHPRDFHSQQGDQIRVGKEVQREMQELTQLLIERPNFHECNTKETILSVVKSFYYLAHCSSVTLDKHMSMVLFDKAK